jgi:two-component system, LytTR family, sensor kinase
VLHPILKNTKIFITYLIIWSVIIAIHIFILIYFNNYGLPISLSESLVFNVLYLLLGIGIWYPVYYTDLEKNKVVNFITNHLASSSLAVGIWLWLGYIVLTNLFSGSQEYIYYLNASIPWRVGLGFLYYVLIISNYYLLIYYQNFKENLIRESELKALIKESELSSLKSQINPHFLFNSLNSISSLTMVSPEKAQEMVINLSDFLRYSLSHRKELLTTLDKELLNIDRYLKIEKTRFGNRLFVEKKIGENCLNNYLPGLILQPIIENAVKYGVYESTERSTITISAVCCEGLLEVSIINDYNPDFISKKGEGIGIRNVSSRLKIQYGREDLLKINKKENSFEVNMRFPQNS